MIPDIEDYFSKGCGRCDRFATSDCSTRRWAGGLHDLRALLRQAGGTESLKWGHPCYTYAGRNIVILGAFRHDFRLTFFNAALMQDGDGFLEKQGPNSSSAGMLRFTANAQVMEKAPIILAYIQEAMGYAAQRLLPAKVPSVIDLPNELIEAFKLDPELADAFQALTPGRKKSYILQLMSTNTPATRTARIVKFRQKILDGKGATER